MVATLDDKTVEDILLGPHNVYAHMTIATGATPGYGVDFFWEEVNVSAACCRDTLLQCRWIEKRRVFGG